MFCVVAGVAAMAQSHLEAWPLLWLLGCLAPKEVCRDLDADLTPSWKLGRRTTTQRRALRKPAVSQAGRQLNTHWQWRRLCLSGRTGSVAGLQATVGRWLLDTLF